MYSFPIVFLAKISCRGYFFPRLANKVAKTSFDGSSIFRIIFLKVSSESKISSTKRESRGILGLSTKIVSMPKWSASNRAGTNPPRLIVEMLEKDLSTAEIFLDRVLIKSSISDQLIFWDDKVATPLLDG